MTLGPSPQIILKCLIIEFEDGVLLLSLQSMAMSGSRFV